MIRDLLWFAVALGVLITVHEAGHFLAARIFSVRVLRFSVGFGPVLLRRTDRHGCEFALSLIPLGGYVKMLGEGPEADSEDANAAAAETQAGQANQTDQGIRRSANAADHRTDDSAAGSFRSRPLWQRAVVIAAGPLANLLLAVIFYAGVNFIGLPTLRPVIGDVVPGSAAAAAGLEPYDLLTEACGQEIRDWRDFMLVLVARAGEHELELAVRGDLGRGAERRLKLVPGDLSLSSRRDPLSDLGLKRCVGRVINEIAVVQEHSAAARAGLKPGDVISEINGQKVTDWFRLQELIAAAPGKLELVVRRDGQNYSAAAEPERVERDGKTQAFLGIGARIEEIPELRVEVSYPFGEALVRGLDDALKMSGAVLTAAGQMLSGAIGADSISGPIAIAQGAGASAGAGAVFFISFLAAISVNLGILNLLPVPVLDGGQLLFLAYEAVMRRPPHPRARMMLTSAGLALLLALMFLAVFNDIRSL